MELQIPGEIVGQIHAHALETLPEECCGFLIGREEGEVRRVTQARRSRNVHPEMREVRYTIEPRAVLEVDREFRGEERLLGFYHSHPGHPARPSAFDRSRAWPWYVYAILEVRDGSPGAFTAWRFDEGREDFEPVPVVRLD